MTQSVPPTTLSIPQPNTRLRRTWLAIGLAAAILIAIGLSVAFLGGNNSSSTVTIADQKLASAQLASVQQSCQQWSGGVAQTAGNASASAVCTNMTAWMGTRLQDGHTTGTMMWGSASTLQTSCRQWMATGSASSTGGTIPPEWCGAMANSMAQHVGNWGSWMTNGNMMGR